jgi:polyhydroxybutyrate depolymerase
MRAGRGAAAIVLLLFAACHAPAPGTAKSGLAGRTFLVHAPARPTAAPRPLVILLHGRYGTGVQVEGHSGLSAIADREGFVAVYPDGVDRSWHDKREDGPAAEQHVDDVAFVSSLIDKMIAEQDVDPKRVYVAGISNGAMMTFRLACDLSEKIAAVGTIVGSLPENGAAACKPAHPMPLLMINGTADPLVPYGGGMVAKDRGRVLSADATRARFAELNGCGPPAPAVTFDRVDDDTSVTELAHTGCAEVRLFSIVGGGHTVPGRSENLPRMLVGRTSRELDAIEELWKFFSRQPAR